MTSTTTRPWPCAIQPATRAPRQLVVRLDIEYQSIWGESHAHRPPNRRADHTDHNDQATRNSSRERETPPAVLDDSGGRSPLIIKDLDLYPQPPTNTRSPTLNSEEPHFCRVDKRRKYVYVYEHAY